MNKYIKLERIKNKFLKSSNPFKKDIINQHISWVKSLKSSGYQIESGFLIDSEKNPGAGGLLIFEASNFNEARLLVEQDPMIKNKLVTWTIHEWIDITK
tara:strand:- start:7950 stop:8246 length:297 start_codon:yes stop_codon:yes gene_type:complete